MSSLGHDLSIKIERIVNQQKNILSNMEDALPHDTLEIYLNFLKYINDNNNKTYYPIYTLREASQCKNDMELLQLVKFFCGSTSNLLRITYCYYNEDDTEEPISAEGYFNALIHDKAPNSLNSGRRIDDFDKSYVSFYCNLNLKCKTQTR